MSEVTPCALHPETVHLRPYTLHPEPRHGHDEGPAGQAPLYMKESKMRTFLAMKFTARILEYYE